MRLNTELSAKRETYAYNQFLASIPVAEVAKQLRENAELGGKAMSPNTLYKIKKAAAQGSGLPGKKRGSEVYGGVMGSPTAQAGK